VHIEIEKWKNGKMEKWKIYKNISINYIQTNG
jgi:hypothetical protein